MPDGSPPSTLRVIHPDLRSATYLHGLTRHVNGVVTGFDTHTVLLARGNILFGWLDAKRDIRPIFNSFGKRLVIHNFEYNQTSYARLDTLLRLGMYSRLGAVPSNNSGPTFRSHANRPERSWRVAYHESLDLNQ